MLVPPSYTGPGVFSQARMNTGDGLLQLKWRDEFLGILQKFLPQ
jgi:hypothetical protein